MDPKKVADPEIIAWLNDPNDERTAEQVLIASGSIVIEQPKKKRRKKAC